MRGIGLVAAVLGATIALPAVAPAQPPDSQQAPVVSRLQSESRLPADRPGGKGRQVLLQQFSIEPRRRDIRLDLPVRGLLLIQLRAGALTTVIGSERQRRLEGEWWTVSPPSALGLETDDDTVVIDTILIAD